jgi:uncharacterized protein
MVKTRLARTVGDVEALRIYQILLGKTRLATGATAAHRWLFYSDDIPSLDDWPTEIFQKKRQSSGDLGARMNAAFCAAFEEGAEKVLIIGSDCPELSGDVLESAFDMLDKADFVIGPVPDGGYYLLGMKTPDPSVFQGIIWSTDTVRADTIEKINALGKSYALLPLLTDIDEASDWEAYLQRSQTAANFPKY